jgi:sigma-B regulation protein RsbU (phosphoserine phosphatase)
VGLAGLDRAEVVAHVNRQLVEENSADMFVTLFSASIDIENGQVRYCNAGHDSPLVIRRDGSVEILGPPTGPAVGVFHDAAFREDRTVLGEGEVLVLFTDGVTEARNPDGEMFGDERLCDIVGRCASLPVEEMTKAIADELAGFGAGAPLADDVTIMVLRYRGSQRENALSDDRNREALTLERGREPLSQLEGFVSRCAARFGLSTELEGDLRLALEELATNTLSHGGGHRIDLAVELVGSDLSIEIEDDAAPFDPLSSNEVDTTSPLEARSVGGLGLHLVRRVMDEVFYERRGALNVVRLRKRVD